MVEALTESFCERCGTRYEFAAPTRLNPLRKTRGFVSGLRNYIMSQDALGEAMGDAMRSEEDALATAQLDAFHESFNFCIDCRQYTCVNCWNDGAGRCRSCVPMAGADDLLAGRLGWTATNGDRAATIAEAGVAEQLGTDAWPVVDLPANGRTPEAEAPAAEPIVVEEPPSPVVVEAEPEPEIVEPAIIEAPPAPEPAIAAVEPEPQLTWPPVSAEQPAQPVTAEAEPEAPPVIAEPEPEPLVAEAEPEPEPVVAEAEPEPEPLVAEAEPEPVVAEAEPEPGERPMLRVLAWDEDAPWIVAAEGEAVPVPEPEVEAEVELPAEAVPGAEAAPAAMAEPEPPAERKRPAKPPTPIRPIAPIAETILRLPPQPKPVEPPVSEPVAAELVDPELAARRAQLDELGLGDPGQGPVTQRPAVLPYRSRGASAHPTDAARLAAVSEGASFWEASAREVAGAVTQVGVQNCAECGLSLSATARFCRRCGTPQARSA